MISLKDYDKWKTSYADMWIEDVPVFEGEPEPRADDVNSFCELAKKTRGDKKPKTGDCARNG